MTLQQDSHLGNVKAIIWKIANSRKVFTIGIIKQLVRYPCNIAYWKTENKVSPGKTIFEQSCNFETNFTNNWPLQ